MTELEQACIENLLNGVSRETLSAQFGIDAEVLEGLEAKVLHLVQEAMANGLAPLRVIPSWPAAMRERLGVLDVLAKVRIWDALDRPLAAALFEATPWAEILSRFGVEREYAEKVLKDALTRIGAHVPSAEQPQFIANPAQWVRQHLVQAIDCLDRLPSWEGTRLKNITFQSIAAEG